MNGTVVSIVCCYYNACEVCRFAEELEKQDKHIDERIHLVIVVNAATEEDEAKLETLEKNPQLPVSIYRPDTNLGYLNGLIYGYSKYREENGIPNYVFMSNTDIEIPSADFISTVLSKNYSDDVWCIGPSIYAKYTNNYTNPTADRRRSLHEIDSLIRRFSTPVFNQLYVMASGVKAKLVHKKKTESRYVYEVHGSFFILKGEFAEYLKSKQFGAFIYCEEAFLAENVYHNGKKIFYDSEIEIIHLEHSVTGLMKVKKTASYLSSSMRYIKEEFYNGQSDK